VVPYEVVIRDSLIGILLASASIQLSHDLFLESEAISEVFLGKFIILLNIFFPDSLHDLLAVILTMCHLLSIKVHCEVLDKFFSFVTDFLDFFCLAIVEDANFELLFFVSFRTVVLFLLFMVLSTEHV
jgi:hypothetical protein